MLSGLYGLFGDLLNPSESKKLFFRESSNFYSKLINNRTNIKREDIDVCVYARNVKTILRGVTKHNCLYGCY